MGLTALTNLRIENLMGAKDKQNKIELALNAELLHKLTSNGDKAYCPLQLVRSTIKVIGHCEKLDSTMKERFKRIALTG